MEDLMIIEYLKRKGLYNLSEREFDDRFKDVMYHHYMKDYKGYGSHSEQVPHIKSAMKDMEYAKYLVSNMFHYEGGRKYIGEKFDVYKAKELCDRHRGMLPPHIDEIDMYIAVNAHYHDYSELYKSWFGEDIEQKIVDSAIKFWFKDDDCKHENKVMAYYK